MDLQTSGQHKLIHKDLYDCQRTMFMYLSNIYIYKFLLHSNQCAHTCLEHQNIFVHNILKWVQQIHLYKQVNIF